MCLSFDMHYIAIIIILMPYELACSAEFLMVNNNATCTKSDRYVTNVWVFFS